MRHRMLNAADTIGVSVGLQSKLCLREISRHEGAWYAFGFDEEITGFHLRSKSACSADLVR
jgi:hypothetical protein